MAPGCSIKLYDAFYQPFRARLRDTGTFLGPMAGAMAAAHQFPPFNATRQTKRNSATAGREFASPGYSATVFSATLPRQRCRCRACCFELQSRRTMSNREHYPVANASAQPVTTYSGLLRHSIKRQQLIGAPNLHLSNTERERETHFMYLYRHIKYTCTPIMFIDNICMIFDSCTSSSSGRLEPGPFGSSGLGAARRHAEPSRDRLLGLGRHRRASWTLDSFRCLRSIHLFFYLSLYIDA